MRLTYAIGAHGSALTDLFFSSFLAGVLFGTDSEIDAAQDVSVVAHGAHLVGYWC